MATVHSDLTTRALSLQPTDLDRLNKAPTARDFHPSSENQNNAGPRDMQENGQGLDRVDSLSLDPAVFEKLFLTPQTLVKHDLRKMFAVPTPLSLVGFGIAFTPLACCLMGWRGSDQQKMGAADIGAYLWFGGLCNILAGLLDFFLGNTYPFVFAMGYGAWFLTYAATLQPFYQAAGSYANATQIFGAPTNPPSQGVLQMNGQLTPGYVSSFAFLIVFMTVFTFILFICSFRVNLILVIALFAGTLAFCLLSAALFIESQALEYYVRVGELQSTGDTLGALGLLTVGTDRLNLALKLVTGGGGAFFAAAMLTWYLTLAIMLAIVDFPILLPVFDLSTVIKGRSERLVLKAQKAEELKSQ